MDNHNSDSSEGSTNQHQSVDEKKQTDLFETSNDLSCPRKWTQEQQIQTISTAHRLAYLVFALCFLIGLILLPSLAERISFSITKGTENAKREEALRFLKEFPEAENRIPWIVKAVSPSVVAINTSLHNGPGLATGVIIDGQNGYIITNFHVICDGYQLVDGVEICLSDGRKQSNGIQLTGFDEQHDLAVLKVDMTDLKAIPWGDSDALSVGETILAIGNPYGLTHTVTQGIVSAKERLHTMPNGTVVQEFLQTDAAINPGNSGGPLINVRGELVGINTAIFGDRYQGISFAIPVNLVKEVYQKIIRHHQETE